MHTLFAFLAILGFLPLILRAALAGTISLNAAAVLMILMVLATLLGVKRFIFKVVMPVVGVALFAAQYANGDTHNFWAILSALLTLALTLLGFYIMLGGLFRTKRR
jgi:hypothetical protein